LLKTNAFARLILWGRGKFEGFGEAASK